MNKASQITTGRARRLAEIRRGVARRVDRLYAKLMQPVRAIRNFENFKDLFRDLREKGDGTSDLRTRDGILITIRRNIWDAWIVSEVFLEGPYLRYIALPANPVVIDIGAYIGDFSIYAARRCNARVFAFEPTEENYKLLLRNIENNSLAGRVIPANTPVAASRSITLNVKCEDQEVHASAYWYEGAEHRQLEALTLADVLELHKLDRVHLLKVDCEGAEYDIFEATSDAVFARIDQVVFEWHKVDRWRERLDALKERFSKMGYRLRERGPIVYALRSGAAAAAAS